MKSITIKLDREDALRFGLLVCKCGYPENNHFAFGKRLCARDPRCRGYKEKSIVGKIIP